MYDYLIVGSGLFGSVFARELTNKGYKCLVVDKRNHIGGNVFTENTNGINVHKYGPHIFHTNDKQIWDYVNCFANFNHYRHKVAVNYEGKILSFPINLLTFSQLFGLNTPNDVQQFLEGIKKDDQQSRSNLEEWIVSQVGSELYKIFIKGYTHKQWGRKPCELPISIISRIPIRTNYDDNYFNDIYQGIPIGGYTTLINNLLEGIEVKLNVDFIKDRVNLSGIAQKIVFTGPIDQYFDYSLGELEYRSLRFEHEHLKIDDFQGVAQMNYTSFNIPYTRIVEHKHFEFSKSKDTIITKEYPIEWHKGIEPYYPINDFKNSNLYKKYKSLAMQQCPDVIFGGRLAEYKYYDMHQVVAAALTQVNKIYAKN